MFLSMQQFIDLVSTFILRSTVSRLNMPGRLTKQLSIHGKWLELRIDILSRWLDSVARIIYRFQKAEKAYLFHQTSGTMTD